MAEDNKAEPARTERHQQVRDKLTDLGLEREAAIFDEGIRAAA